ncbi:MAG: MoxR family ATPase [Acidobacteriota bacterium]|nr:MoxR family ATPase [Acidobacteriota bacterium]
MTEQPHAALTRLIDGFGAQGYVLERDLATVLFLLTRLGKPLLIEGHAGVGKTEASHALAKVLDTELIRLQCYEGLDVNTAVYEWNYQKQLLAIKLQEGSDRDLEQKEAHVFSREFMLERPLLRSITARDKAPVLLIDEIDRADEEFEAFLLELLSAYQITIPELGTVRAEHKPHVILTSNRTRELSDALKRRCLYHWIDYPDSQVERRIVTRRMPDIEAALADQVVAFMQYLRGTKLTKIPGVAETLDWSAALQALGAQTLDEEILDATLGCILKTTEDMSQIRQEGITQLLAKAGAAN